jgi:DtxR family Mn-dependent transcriptional regulator
MVEESPATVPTAYTEDMAFEDLSTNSQDYLKVIWDLQEWTGQAVAPKSLAEKTGMKLSTVSGAITRLTKSGLVQHDPYGAITLTDEGEEYALIMVRRHRLLEAFLVQTLGYSWDEVHEEADSLEHAVSNEMVDRIDGLLGHPAHDPHGDPIPTADGTVEEEPNLPLSAAPENSVVSVERVSDEDPDLLRYLKHEGISVGTQLRIERKAPFSNSVGVTVLSKTGSLDSAEADNDSLQTTVALGTSAAEFIRVRTLQD